MRIFNLFRKKEVHKVDNPQVNPVDSLVKPNHYYTLFGKNWAIEDSINFQSQSIVEGMKPYGWTFEVSWSTNNGTSISWTSWNRKVYYSADSATSAALNCYLSKNHDYKWRIRPLYSMDQQEWRDYKIDKLLDEVPKKEKSKYEIKGWKVKEDCEVEYSHGVKTKYIKGTLFIQLENGEIVQLKNSRENIRSGRYQLFNNLIPNGLVEEVKIEDEKWSHPHLLKEVRNKLIN